MVECDAAMAYDKLDNVNPLPQGQTRTQPSLNVGLQFHLETTPDSLQSMITNCGHELIPAEFIQSEQNMMSATPVDYQTINAVMASILNYLVEK